MQLHGAFHSACRSPGETSRRTDRSSWCRGSAAAMSWSNEREQNAGVWSGLDQLASLPDWLNAATDPERVLRALALAIPELVSGVLTISARLKRGDWIGVYTLTFGETHSSGPRVVVLRGTILPPDRPVPPGLTADPP